MNRFNTLLLMVLITANGGAKESSKTLNDAVNQAKSQGQVLSAKTVNGQHQIKVLTPNGSVKTIRQQSARPKQGPRYDQQGGRSVKHRRQNPVIPNHHAPPRTNRPNVKLQQNRSAASRPTRKDKDK